PIVQKFNYKTLPVQPDVKGNVALGYQITGVMPQPATVTLVGDPNALSGMQLVKTQPVNIQDATSDREVSTTLALPPTVALVQPQAIVVRVLVTELQGTKTILVSPRIANEAPNVTYVLTPPAVSVTLSGAVPDLTRLQPEDVPVVADVKGMASGSQTVVVIVGYP